MHNLELCNLIYKNIDHVLHLDRLGELTPLSSYILSRLVKTQFNGHLDCVAKLVTSYKIPYIKELTVCTGITIPLMCRKDNMLMAQLIISGYKYLLDDCIDSTLSIHYERQITGLIITHGTWYVKTPKEYYQDEYMLDKQVIGIIVLYLGFNELYNLYQASKQYSDVIETYEIIGLLVNKWLPDHRVSLICNYTELFITYNIVNNGCLADLNICLAFRDVFDTTKLAFEECDVRALGLLPQHDIVFNVEVELTRALRLDNKDMIRWIVVCGVQSGYIEEIRQMAVLYFNESDTRLHDCLFSVTQLT